MGLEQFASKVRKSIIQPAASIIKVALRSELPGHASLTSETEKPLIIMGNGPSLRSFIEFAGENPDILSGFALEGVNFAAITPEFFVLRPMLYVLADPHFFRKPGEDEKVDRLWENLQRCNWSMTLWIPAKQAGNIAIRCHSLPANIVVRKMNLTPVEGEGFLTNFLINKGFGMPRPRNVLIPAIMTAIWSGYRKIYLVGADHSWLNTLSVDDENRVVSIQPHFYKDDERERKRVDTEYEGYHLHDILNSMTIAFRSYFEIRGIAQSLGIEIINATPDSFIDAFPRCGYAQMTPISKQ